MEDTESYKKVFLEMVSRTGPMPMVWSAHMYSSFKEYFEEDAEGYKTFRGTRIYFVNEQDGSLIDWRNINV